MNETTKKEVRMRKAMALGRGARLVTPNSMYLTKQKPVTIVRLDQGRPNFGG